MTTAIHRRTRTVRQRQRPHSHPARLQLHLALRLLRQGYLHVYMPQAAAGTEQWRTYHVDDEANMRLIGPGFVAPAAGTKIPPCQTPGHDAYGQKLITIPNASRMSEVWLAFSANLWSDKLKDQNKANPKAMVKFNPKSGGANTFKPTKEELSKRVLECAMDALRIDGMGDNNALPQAVQPSFPFAPLMGSGRGKDYKPSDDSRVQRLADALAKAAASSPSTKGKELAVVVPDPVGVTAELQDLRILAERRAIQLTQKDEHRMQSHFALKGLAKNVADLRALNTWAPVITKQEFDRITRAAAYKGTWVSLDEKFTIESGSVNTSVSPQTMGRYWMQGRREMLHAKLPEFQEKAKQEIESGYDPQASEAWFKALQEKTQQAIEPYESQWLSARNHASTAQYFSLHFDEAEPNKPKARPGHCAGSAYVQECSHTDGPPPKTSVALLDAYMAAYYKKPEDPQAFTLRAMVANQQALFGELTKQLGGDPNGDGMRDKTVDFIKGLLDLNNGHLKLKYSWLSDATMTLAMGPMNHLPTAMGTYVALAGADALKTKPRVAALATNAAFWFAGINTALQSALTQKVVRPVMVQAWVDSDLVDQSVQGVGKQRKSVKHQRGGKTLVTLLTDTERLAKQPSVAQLLAESSGSQLAFGKAAGAAMVAGAGSGTIVLLATDARSAHASNMLFAQQVQEAINIAGSVRAAVPTGVRAVTMSIDGRLALASVIVQSIGIINGRKAVANAEDALKKASTAEREAKEKKLRNDALGLMDSWGGLVAGCLDTLRVAAEAMNLQRGAAAGGAALGSIHALKFAGQMAGVFGGFLNGYVSYLRMQDADRQGQSTVATLHLTSAISFAGTGFTSLTGAALIGAEYIVAREIGSKAVQQAAGRFVAARVAGIAVSAAIPVVGWVLLGAGIVASVGAALLEPTQLEAWAKQTPFGNGPEGVKFKTVAEQNNALNKALGLAQTADAEAKAA